MDIYQIAWLVIIIAFLAVEIATSGLTTIWFAIGAALAFLASLFSASFSVQIIIFMISSIALFVGFFPFVKRRLGAKSYDTNVDSIIGKEAVITENISFNTVGKASVNGVIWSAISEKPEAEIVTGTTVKIEKIAGNKLIVKALQ